MSCTCVFLLSSLSILILLVCFLSSLALLLLFSLLGSASSFCFFVPLHKIPSSTCPCLFFHFQFVFVFSAHSQPSCLLFLVLPFLVCPCSLKFVSTLFWFSLFPFLSLNFCFGFLFPSLCPCCFSFLFRVSISLYPISSYFQFHFITLSPFIPPPFIPEGSATVFPYKTPKYRFGYQNKKK